MGASFSTINERHVLESIVVEYILKSSTKDLHLIDSYQYNNNTINILVDILMKYVDLATIDKIFYHIGGEDNMIEIDLDTIHYTNQKIDARIKCKFLAIFYYEIYVLFNKIKSLIVTVNNLIQQAEQEYIKYQHESFDDSIADEIELLELKLNRLRFIEINFYIILGELFVKDKTFGINNDISLERMEQMGNIIDFEINTFSNKINSIDKCE
jgi:hypothetical protein|uniref:Uncharacterized protein n=1 Tax=viral metagenome TaxID=1070528 RepID=A0A6C0BYQ5_9ZZZZ